MWPLRNLTYVSVTQYKLIHVRHVDSQLLRIYPFDEKGLFIMSGKLLLPCVVTRASSEYMHKMIHTGTDPLNPSPHDEYTTSNAMYG